MQLTVHETLQLNELVRMESGDVQKLQAILPMVSDAELRQEISSCIQAGSSHVKALVDLSKKAQCATQ